MINARVWTPLVATLLFAVPLHGQDETPAPTIVETMQAEAAKLRPLVSSPAARAFLDATEHLVPAPARTVYRDSETRRYLSPQEAEALDADARDRLDRYDLDASRYYITKYGSPLAYVRALDLVGNGGFDDWAGARVLDFGYGTIGHLRLMAANGADVVGVDVDSFLPALYSAPDDQGPVEHPGGDPGSVRIVDGRWPSTSAVIEAIGDGYDLFISKNTLKRGYVHPAREVDPRMTIDLGVDDDTYVANLARIVKPGGYVLIYNISPKLAADDEPYIPWADGRCPFERELWTTHGFEIVAWDIDDSATVRAMAHALGWDAGERPMDLQADLFGMYSIFRRHETAP